MQFDQLKRRDFITLLGGAAVILPAAVGAESFPTRPIRLIVPYPAGGGTDIVGRVLGQKLHASLGQPVVIRIGGSAETLRPEGLELLFRVLTTSPKIERAAHYALHEPNWYGYYKVFEAICEHVGGYRCLECRGWFNSSEIRRFTWSAQPFRHHNKPPPQKAMSEAEGRAFALALIEHAVAEAIAKPQAPA